MEIQNEKYLKKIVKKGITFFSKSDLGTLYTDIFYILNGNGNVVEFDYKKDIKELGNNIKLYDLGLGNYLLEAKSKGILKELINKVENDGIIIKGEFEFKNKYYFILYKPKQNGEINIQINNIKDGINKII